MENGSLEDDVFLFFSKFQTTLSSMEVENGSLEDELSLPGR